MYSRPALEKCILFTEFCICGGPSGGRHEVRTKKKTEVNKNNLQDVVQSLEEIYRMPKPENIWARGVW